MGFAARLVHCTAVGICALVPATAGPAWPAAAATSSATAANPVAAGCTVAKLELGGFPRGVAVNGKTGTVYVTNTREKELRPRSRELCRGQ